MLYSKLENYDFIARIDARTDIQPNQTIKLAFDMNKAHFFDKDTEERIK